MKQPFVTNAAVDCIEPFYDLRVGRSIQWQEQFSGTDFSLQASLVSFQNADPGYPR